MRHFHIININTNLQRTDTGYIAYSEDEAREYIGNQLQETANVMATFGPDTIEITAGQEGSTFAAHATAHMDGKTLTHTFYIQECHGLIPELN